MFGHQDDQHDDQHHDDTFVPESTTDTAFAANTPQDGGAPAPDQPANDTANPALPTDMTMFSPQVDAPADDAAHHDDAHAGPTFEPYTDHAAAAPDVPADDNASPAPASGDNGDLLGIKTQALQQLSPLVDHLEQSPEEKFRTTMMMIQANDDQNLVKVAYEAAQAIGDPKTKAQALLDIVNEINYFTHQQDSPSQ